MNRFRNYQIMGKDVGIPGSVRKIGMSAFEDCTSLRSIRYGGTQEQWAALENDSPVSGAAVQFIND